MDIVEVTVNVMETYKKLSGRKDQPVKKKVKLFL
jgi:hypothetical protein